MVSIRLISICLILPSLAMVGCGEETSGDPAPSPVDVGDDTTQSDAMPPDGDGGPHDDATGDLGPETTGDAAVEDTADASEPAGPILIEAEVTWAGWSMTIREAPSPFALVTSAGTVLQDSDGALSIIDVGGFESSLEVETSPLHAGVELGGSGSLFAGDEGLLGFVEGIVTDSPLNEYIADPVQAMVYGAPSDQLWLSTGSALMLHEDGALYDIEPDGLPTGPAHLAYGGHLDGAPAVWVASGSSIYALSGTGDELIVGAWVEGISVLDLTCDSAGRVWASADGDLYRRSTDGVWDWLRLPSPVGNLAAHPASGALWIATSDGLWRHEDGLFGPVDDGALGSWLTVDDSGSIIGSNVETVWRMGVGEEPLPPPPPTWTQDIAPISDARCVLCHGPGALGAAQMYQREQWEERIDDILLVVSSGAMPLPPNPVLDPAMIARIESWKAAGFPL
jgi:hypothetical protein